MSCAEKRFCGKKSFVFLLSSGFCQVNSPKYENYLNRLGVGKVKITTQIIGIIAEERGLSCHSSSGSLSAQLFVQEGNSRDWQRLAWQRALLPKMMHCSGRCEGHACWQVSRGMALGILGMHMLHGHMGHMRIYGTCMKHVGDHEAYMHACIVQRSCEFTTGARCRDTRSPKAVKELELCSSRPIRGRCCSIHDACMHACIMDLTMIDEQKIAKINTGAAQIVST